MGLIGKIRNKSGFLIFVIGAAMVLFILGDFLSSGRQMFGDQTTDIAEIHGDPISITEFEQRLQDELARAYGTQPVDEEAREQVRQRLWNTLLQERVMFREYEELGIFVSTEELFNEVKRNNPVLVQYFTNPQTGRIIEDFQDPVTGGLSSDRVMTYLKQLFESEQGDTWIPVERAIKFERYRDKYYQLIKKGIYVTTREAEYDYLVSNRKIKFRYVLKGYDAISDTAVTVTEDDIEKYYRENNHKPEYQQKETTRSIEYVSFEVTPSGYDIRAIKDELEGLKEEFKNAEDDTLFVNRNGDTPLNLPYLNDGAFPPEIDTLIFKADTGAVFGPFLDGDAYKLAKVIGFDFRSDSVEARHILIRMDDGDTTKAQALADSLKLLIQAQDNFAAMAEEHSGDFGSAQEGGNLGWFAEGMMVPTFNDACFEGEVGDMPIVISQFGVHLIEILDKTEEKKKLHAAIVDRMLEPSKTTFDSVYNKASVFSIENDTPDKFKQAGNEMGIIVADAVLETDKTLNDLDAPREMIRWAYKEEIGAVSPPFELGNRFVIAHLSGIKEEGTLSLDVEEIKDRIEMEVTKEKKAEMLINSMSGFTLEEVASNLKLNIETVEELAFSAYSIPAVGVDQKLIGSLFSMQQGQTSPPIKGEMGVYAAIVDQITEPTPATELVSAKTRLEQTIVTRADYAVFNALQENANIVDNRPKFY